MNVAESVGTKRPIIDSKTFNKAKNGEFVGDGFIELLNAEVNMLNAPMIKQQLV